MFSRHGLACWLCVLAGLAFAALLSVSRSASAAWPPSESPDGGAVNYADPSNWPSDPSYAGDWELWSFVPQQWKGHVTDENKRLGTGAHVDRAWALSTGDRRVLISVLDSGANWSNADLANKWYLNRGELPAPMGCPGADGKIYDVNGDGYFNIQDYTTVKGHNVAGFSSVCDPRVIGKGDVNQNNILDPQDLIAAFSDGKDGDANGYIDDISGWDFFRNDNDAQDDTAYGHGNGEANDSSAEGDNKMGNIGTCPDCSVQLLRVGDSFLADGNDFGMATIFAVDSGTSVVQEALGAIDNTALSKTAIDYAYANNVVVIASMADEDSYHHNFPAAHNHMMTVHAVTHDTESVDTSSTFLNFNNCTDYGAQLMLSVPGGACSSEATGKSAGMAGLIYAAALAANLPAPQNGHAGDPNRVRRVTAEEVMALLVNGVDDIYDPADAADPTKYPTRVGWEQRFGYGRVNARASVEQVVRGRIPPEVELRSPEMFEIIYPDKTPMVPIVGHVSFRNQVGNKFGDSFDFILEWAPGNEPDDSQWKTIGTGAMMASGLEGTLATWDVSQITVDNPSQGPPDNLVNRYMVTLRLRAKVHSIDPNLEGLSAQARRPAFIFRDPDLLAGFPIHLGASGESSMKIVDLNGDGKWELLVGDTTGRIHAFQADGSDLAGWPVKANLLPALDTATGRGHGAAAAFTKGATPVSPDQRSAFLATPAVGDIDGDKKPEVCDGDYDGNIYCWHADGSMVSGWPRAVDRAIVAERKDRRHPAAVDDAMFASPAMADFDGDGVNELVTADGVGEVTVWKGNGEKLPGFPVRVWDTTLADDPKADQPRQANRLMSSPALGDLDGDGTPDIVVGSNENYDSQGRLYALSGKTGMVLPGFPIHIVSTYVLPVVGSGIPNAPALADLDGDKIPEIAVAGIGGAIRAYDHNGKTFRAAFPNAHDRFGAKSVSKSNTTFAVVSNPSFGDIDDDGVVDLLYGLGGDSVLLAMATGGQRRDFEFSLGAWDTKTSAFKPGFPTVMEDYQFFLTPIVADIDGDGHSEVINGSAGYFLHAFRADGSEPKGFPKFTGQWIAASPAVGDMDGDGKLELAVATREGWVYAWHTAASAKGRIDWESFHHDARNTGNFDVPLAQGVHASPAAMPMGCACSVAGGAAGGGPWLFGALAAIAVTLRGRRRRAR